MRADYGMTDQKIGGIYRINMMREYWNNKDTHIMRYDGEQLRYIMELEKKKRT